MTPYSHLTMNADLILVIDDQRTFPFPAVYARTSAEGLALLDANAYAEVWLDHDLGGRDDIWPVADELIRRALNGAPLPLRQLVVHTANPPAGSRLVAALERYYPVRRVSARHVMGL